MPVQDGTGPQGRGPLTGRGFGPCGRGYGCRFGYQQYSEPTKEEQKKFLEAEKKAIEQRIKELEE